MFFLLLSAEIYQPYKGHVNYTHGEDMMLKCRDWLERSLVWYKDDVELTDGPNYTINGYTDTIHHRTPISVLFLHKSQLDDTDAGVYSCHIQSDPSAGCTQIQVQLLSIEGKCTKVVV